MNIVKCRQASPSQSEQHYYVDMTVPRAPPVKTLALIVASRLYLPLISTVFAVTLHNIPPTCHS